MSYRNVAAISVSEAYECLGFIKQCCNIIELLVPQSLSVYVLSISVTFQLASIARLRSSVMPNRN